MAQEAFAEEAGGNAQVFVLVANDRFTQWSTIREPARMFDVQTTRKRLVEPNTIVLADPEKIDTLKGRRLRATIEAGHILTSDDLLKKEVSGIDGMLEKGKHAVSVPISADRAIAFFVVPGSKVDVIQTVDGKPKVILEDIVVLAIDLSTARAEDKPPMGGATATLQVNNEQKRKLTAARDKGTLSLVMRPLGDDDKDAPVKPPPPPFEDKKK